jgi:predicted RNA-binding protein with PUA-like domain
VNRPAQNELLSARPSLSNPLRGKQSYEIPSHSPTAPFGFAATRGVRSDVECTACITGAIEMSSAYLLKTEPSEYSFADLQRDKSTTWDGISNPAAIKNLREMQPGAKLIIYETGKITSAVGTATVVSVDASDPKKPLVKIAAGKSLAKPISLGAIKAHKLFAASSLVRQARLSVVPLTTEQYHALVDH